MEDRFIILDVCSFELYPEIKEGVILSALLKEFKKYKLSSEVYDVLVEAWNSRFWVDKGYDGATIIKNKKHPAICNFIHDYHYRCGFGGLIADVIYRELLKLTGYPKYTPQFRFYSIRIFGSYFRIKHIIKGNVNIKSQATLDLYEYFT
tara:strand:+ start:937 stop:1383 length:447 start_codon:yes stop_codon:yes gene_type:complete